MTVVDLAALIAAVAFALLAITGIFVLFRLARLLSATTRLAELAERRDALLDRAEPVTASTDERSTDEPGAGSDPVGEASAERVLAGRLGALVYGVRYAMALRHTARDAVPARNAVPARVIDRGGIDRREVGR
jgi:hypothetical protein